MDHKSLICPRDSKKYPDKSFVGIDNGSMGGSHWCASDVKNRKSFYFDSFGGQPDKFLPNQLHKPKIYHSYKMQDENSNLCGSSCSYFFIIIERMKYYEANSKMYIGYLKMPMTVFSNRSKDSENKIDISVFVKKTSPENYLDWK